MAIKLMAPLREAGVLRPCDGCGAPARGGLNFRLQDAAGRVKGYVFAPLCERCLHAYLSLVPLGSRVP